MRNTVDYERTERIRGKVSPRFRQHVWLVWTGVYIYIYIWTGSPGGEGSRGIIHAYASVCVYVLCVVSQYLKSGSAIPPCDHVATVRRQVLPYYTILHCTVLYCTILYYTILNYTIRVYDLQQVKTPASYPLIAHCRAAEAVRRGPTVDRA